MTVISTYKNFTIVNSQSKWIKNSGNNVILSMLKHFTTVNYDRRKNDSYTPNKNLTERKKYKKNINRQEYQCQNVLQL